MPTGTLPRAAPPGVPGSPEWQEQVAAWGALLARCCRRPTRGRVHGLRSSTLRLQSQLEFWRECATPAAATEHTLRRWIRQAVRLRRWLHTVREADVCLARLKRLGKRAQGPGGAEPRLSAACLRQMKALERGLERRRRTAAAKLTEKLNARHQRLARLGEALAAVPTQHACAGTGPAMEKISARIVAAAAEFPELNAGNLHAFRCTMRRVHYLAAQLAPVDACGHRLAATLQRMQTAAGEWHDWQLLAKEAVRAFPKKAGAGSLAATLESQADASLHKALSLCGRFLRRF